ncbi:transposase [Streptomyces sp. NPDC056682]|uniref:transposase n=1 Tax=Streptomyces sp. NPDC056682 TaxID=3345909 RepID=UPI0036CCD5ED
MGTSKYSPEFRAGAVAFYHAGPGGTYASVTKDLGISHETLRTWVRDAEHRPPGPAPARPAHWRGRTGSCGRE